jgi:hypothetical protein
MMVGNGVLGTNLSITSEVTEAVTAPDRRTEQLRVLQSILSQVVDGNLSPEEAGTRIRETVPELADVADWVSNLWNAAEAVAESEARKVLGMMLDIISAAIILNSCISGTEARLEPDTRREIIRETVDRVHSMHEDEPDTFNEEREVVLKDSCLKELEKRELLVDQDTSSSIPDSTK